MTAAANPNAYPAPPWASPAPPPWNSQAWPEPPFWHPAGMSRPVGIAAMILGFVLFWPVGLAMLAFLFASGRLGCRRRWAPGSNGANQANNEWQPISPPWAAWRCGPARTQSSGNHAFDDYRADTIRRLEEEQTEFSSFLERLRFAKDKAEFDQFMAERRQTPRPPAPPQQPVQG